MRRNISYIDYNDTEEDPIYCPYCLKVDVKVKLQPHYYDIYGRDLIDPDNFLQCPRNGNHLIPIYEAKQEGEYGPIIDLIENPFDSGSEFKGVEKRSKRKKRRVRKLDKVDTDIASEHGEVKILYDSSGQY